MLGSRSAQKRNLPTSISSLVRWTSKSPLTQEIQHPPSTEETVGGIPMSSEKALSSLPGSHVSCWLLLIFYFLFLLESGHLKSICHSNSWHCCGDQRRFVKTLCTLCSMRIMTNKWYKRELTLPKTKKYPVLARKETYTFPSIVSTGINSCV